MKNVPGSFPGFLKLKNLFSILPIRPIQRQIDSIGFSLSNFWHLTRILYLIVAKISPKIFLVSFNSGCRNAFYRWQLDLTFGDFCPPTLTLPLGGGREGWG
jgi:hypothetical protein